MAAHALASSHHLGQPVTQCISSGSTTTVNFCLFPALLGCDSGLICCSCGVFPPVSRKDLRLLLWVQSCVPEEGIFGGLWTREAGCWSLSTTVRGWGCQTWRFLVVCHSLQSRNGKHERSWTNNSEVGCDQTGGASSFGVYCSLTVCSIVDSGFIYWFCHTNMIELCKFDSVARNCRMQCLHNSSNW